MTSMFYDILQHLDLSMVIPVAVIGVFNMELAASFLYAIILKRGIL
jgi:hypothetical protein